LNILLKTGPATKKNLVAFRYEDRTALDGGEEGLDVIHIILEIAHKVLQPEG
jgi:methylase of polypeptide subunit release factors